MPRWWMHAFRTTLILGVVCSPTPAQDSQLVLSSASSVPGGTVTLNLSLNTSAPIAALQWTFIYSPAQITALSVTADPAVLAAGKSISCAPSAGVHTCLASGLNANPMTGGVIATVNVTVASLAGFAPIRISQTSGATPEADAVAISHEGPPIFRTEQPLRPHHHRSN